jgi:hypothetical protein
MSEGRGISMSEFKTVVEGFRSDMKRVVEVVNHRFDQSDKRMERMEGDIHSMKEQVALLHEGQTEIKMELKKKVSYDDFEKLELRVARLESKVA